MDLAVTELGGGPPLLFLHGLLGRARNWLTVGRALADRYSVRLVDLRNHGASPWSAEAGYAAMAADVASLIEAAAAGPVTLPVTDADASVLGADLLDRLGAVRIDGARLTMLPR